MSSKSLSSSSTTTTATTTTKTSNTNKKKKNDDDDSIVLWITYLNIVLYALCFQLQRPIEPFLVQSLSSSTSSEDYNDNENIVRLRYGQLQSFFSFIQTIGSPLVGIMLDRIGIRNASMIVFTSSALSYFILSISTDLSTLFISKIPTALQHAFLVAQAAAATSTANNETARATALGRMTTAYTVGATLGPIMGGYFAKSYGDLYLGARLAIIGSLISVVLSMLYLPNNVPPTTTTSNGGEDEPLMDGSSSKDKIKSSSSSFWTRVQGTLNMAMRSALWPLLLVKVVGGISDSIFSTALPMVLTQQLEYDPAQLGIQQSSNMGAVAIFGAVCMAPLANWLKASGMSKIGLVLRSILVLCIAMIIANATIYQHDMVVIQIIITSIVRGLASHCLATGLTTQTTGSVNKNEQGSLLGLEHGLFSLARVGAPHIGTALLSTNNNINSQQQQQGDGFWMVAIACCLIDIVLAGLLIWKSSSSLSTAAAAVKKNNGQAGEHCKIT